MNNIESPVRNIFHLSENGIYYEFPAWADFLISIGRLCRVKKLSNAKNIVTIVTLPNRNFAAGFVSLGSMLQGAKVFQDILSWKIFRGMPVKSEVYFRPQNGQLKYKGNIVEFTEVNGEECIVVAVTNPINLAKKGTKYLISENKFDNYFFSIEQPLSDTKTESMHRAAYFYNEWLGSLNPKWIASDGAESLVVGTLSELTFVYKNLFISSDNTKPISMDEILCMQKIKEPRHGKIRITHSRGDLDGLFPLLILDGADAFNILSQGISHSNIIVLLERSEYHENIHNTLLQLKQTAEDITFQMFECLPEITPAGIEFISFAVS